MDKNKKETIIAEIVDLEWEMFHSTPNIGGPALCQHDRKTFEINRFAQAMSWSEATLESYLADLSEANNNNRNLVTEKYARMMKSTSPKEYAQIEHLLLPLDPEVSTLVGRITDIVIQWEEDLCNKYPYILKQGRPLYSTDDNFYTTSIETYLRGELSTYSLKTLKLYYEDILKYKSDNTNGSEIILEHVMNNHGFKSLQEANTALK